MRRRPNCGWRSPPNPSWWSRPKRSCAASIWPCWRLRPPRRKRPLPCANSSARPASSWPSCSGAGPMSGSCWPNCTRCCSKTKTCARRWPWPNGMASWSSWPGCSTTSGPACKGVARPWRLSCAISRCCASRWNPATSPMWWPAPPASPCSSCWPANARSCWNWRCGWRSG